MHQLVEIVPHIFWMPYPASDRIAQLGQKLNAKYGPSYYIWSLSEHVYERAHFNHQVAVHKYLGFSSPPLYELLLICKGIFEWVLQGNVAIFHCQSNRGRSVLLISLLLHFIYSYPLTVCKSIAFKILQIKAIYPTQNQCLANLQTLLENRELNSSPIKLKAVILSQRPTSLSSFLAFLQVLDKDQVIYEHKVLINEQYECIFSLPSLIINQDIFIRCLQLQQDTSQKMNTGAAIPIFRFQLHSNFMTSDIIRLRRSEIDINQVFDFDPDFFIDVIYSKGAEDCMQVDLKRNEREQKQREGIKVITQLRQRCQELGSNMQIRLFEENIIPMQSQMALQELELEAIRDVEDQKEENQQGEHEPKEHPQDDEDDNIII